MQKQTIDRRPYRKSEIKSSGVQISGVSETGTVAMFAILFYFFRMPFNHALTIRLSICETVGCNMKFLL
jgi:hypothetical protein